jgi:hypothetical protein
MAIALLAPALGCVHGRVPDQLDSGCTARMQSRIPDSSESQSLTATPIKSRPIGAKRLLFHRGDIVLVVDYAVLRSKTVAFMEAQGAWAHASEEKLLGVLDDQLDQANELVIDEAESPATWSLLEYHIAEVLEVGAFELRAPGRAIRPAQLILKVDWSYYCGPECAARGRVFVTEDCRQLLDVTDMLS